MSAFSLLAFCDRNGASKLGALASSIFFFAKPAIMMKQRDEYQRKQCKEESLSTKATEGVSKSASGMEPEIQGQGQGGGGAGRGGG